MVKGEEEGGSNNGRIKGQDKTKATFPKIRERVFEGVSLRSGMRVESLHANQAFLAGKSLRKA